MLLEPHEAGGPLPKLGFQAVRHPVSGADRALYVAGKRSGAFPIRRNGTPDLSHHDLRRTFIRLILETGKVGIWDVAQMVGHKSADLTIHYAGLDRERATEAARALEAGLGLAPGKQ